MRLICDANVGSIIARALVDAGHDVVRTIHILPDADDATILRYAQSDARVLVTCDSDFGELVFLHRMVAPPAILYIRFEPSDVRDIIPRLLPLLDFTVLDGHMTVIGVDHDRRTPFPVRADNG